MVGNKILFGILAAEAAVCFLVWRSYEKPQIDQNTAMAWCAIALAAAFSLRVFSSTKLWIGFLGVIAAAIAANMLNITVDVSRDPTSHNLFPFELVMTAVIAASGGIVGLGFGSLFHNKRG
jgi:uncharacterized membrane protein YfcA